METEERKLSPGAAAAAALVSPLADFYGRMWPWLALAAVLIVADARFGVAAARKRGERIRLSRLWRRSLAKAMDYLCWVTVAGMCTRSFGAALGVPVVSLGLLFVVYGIEVTSCVNNYLEYKEIKKRFNFFKLLSRKAMEDILEDGPGNKEEESDDGAGR